jgi:hypothetical protein
MANDQVFPAHPLSLWKKQGFRLRQSGDLLAQIHDFASSPRGEFAVSDI